MNCGSISVKIANKGPLFKDSFFIGRNEKRWILKFSVNIVFAVLLQSVPFRERLFLFS